ncbi:ABC transporter permease [Halovenus marina]|uniref:ABC transporter permease n=1 Tax=Halovenus marina TaxID=3396621 RepID=UPI003F5471E4
MTQNVRTRSLASRLYLNKYTLGRLLVPVVLLIIWQLVAMQVGPRLFPTPGQTWDRLLQAYEAGWLVPNTRNTIWAGTLAFLLAASSGLLFGVFVGMRTFAYDLAEPPLVSMYAVPKLTFYPVFLFVLGLGFNTKVIYAAATAFFPMALLTMRAIRNVDETYLAVGKSLNLNIYQMFRYIMFPTTIVQLVVALRLTFSSMFVSLIVAELFVSRAGLGQQLQQAMGIYDAERIMAIIVVIVLVAFVVNAAFYWAQKALERRWNMTADSMNV